MATVVALKPVKAIVGLDALVGHLDQLRAAVAAEADGVARQWQGLGRVGGQREDHAAALLSLLRPHLAELSRWAGACVEQLDGMKADPFGDE